MSTQRQAAFYKRLLEELKQPIAQESLDEFAQLDTKDASKKIDALLELRDRLQTSDEPA